MSSKPATSSSTRQFEQPYMEAPPLHTSNSNVSDHHSPNKADDHQYGAAQTSARSVTDNEEETLQVI